MINQRKTGATLSYIYLILNCGISILYTPLMLRLMGQSEYGLYVLVSSVIAYLSVLDMGFGNAIIRYTAKYRALNDKEGEYKLNGMFLGLYTIIGIVAFIIGIVLCSNVALIFGSSLTEAELETAKILMIILVLNVAISFPLSIFGAIITAYEQFAIPKILNIIRALIQPAVMIPLLLMGYKSIAMVIVTTALNIFILLFNMVYCFRKLKIKIVVAKPDMGLLKEIGTYSFFILLNIIVDKIYLSTDKFLLGIVSGTVAVAIYGVAMQLYDYYIMFSTSINGVFLPRITEMVVKGADDEEISDLFIKIGRIQFMIMALILSGFVSVGHDFIIRWAGADYEQAYYIEIILMVPALVPLVQNTGISILQAKNIHKFRSVVYLFVAIANIFISIPLAKEFGGIGAAIGTGIATCIGQIIVMNIYYHKKAHLNIIKFWKEMMGFLPAVIGCLVVGGVLNMLWQNSGYFSIIVKGCVCVAVYGIILWLFCMNEYEKGLIRKPVEKVLGKLKRR